MFAWVFNIPGIGTLLRWLFPRDPEDTEGLGPFG